MAYSPALNSSIIIKICFKLHTFSTTLQNSYTYISDRDYATELIVVVMGGFTLCDIFCTYALWERNPNALSLAMKLFID